MSRDAKDGASAADAMQAEYFRGFLDQQQSALTDQLASLTRRLTACMTTGEMTPISHVRRYTRLIAWRTPSPDGLPTMQTSSAKLSQFGFDVAFHQQGYEVANRSALEAGILFTNNPADTIRFHCGVGGGEALGQLVDDLLFAQLDHVHSVQPQKAAFH